MDQGGRRRVASTTSSCRSATSSLSITDDRQGSPRPSAPGFGISTPRPRSSPGITCIGTVDEICDQLVARRERWGVSYVVIGDDIFEAFAPVVERLAGT